MNAYKKLNIDLLSKDDDVIDMCVKENMEKMFLEKLLKMKEILDNGEDNIVETLETCDIILHELLTCFISYKAIMAKENRIDYSKEQQKDVDVGCMELKSEFDNSVVFRNYTRKNDEDKSEFYTPYQILKCNKNINLKDDSEDIGIQTRYWGALKLALTNIKTTDVDSLISTFLQLYKYNWAYKQVKNTRARIDHKLRTIKFEAKRISKNMDPIRPVIYTKPLIHVFRDDSSGEEDRILRLSQEKLLKDKSIVLDQEFMYQYRLSEHTRTGFNKTTYFFSNINMAALDNNQNYERIVRSLLLDDATISLGKKYFSGYIGELSANGKIHYNPYNLAALLKLKQQIVIGKENNIKKQNDIEKED